MHQEVPATERLWLTDPRRKTALAVVTATEGGRFAMDRSLYCPRSTTYRHPQPTDRGTVWVGGEKRKLVKVFERGGALWHRLSGTVPAVGEKVQAHLDAPRRERVARTHLAMHLLLHTWPRAVGALVADPEVRGGGHIRLTTDAAFVAPQVLADWRQAVLRLVQDDRPVARTHVADDAVPHALSPQPFADGTLYPGPAETREAVAIEGVGALPCDGTLADRTGDVGDVVVRQARSGRDGLRIMWQVRDARQ